MLELLVYLVPVVIVDAMNPVLAAAVIFALGTRKPYSAALWVLSGWFVVYFVAGIGLAVGLERVTGAHEALVQMRASHPPKPGTRLTFNSVLEAEVLERRGDLYLLRFGGVEDDVGRRRARRGRPGRLGHSSRRAHHHHALCAGVPGHVQLGPQRAVAPPHPRHLGGHLRLKPEPVLLDPYAPDYLPPENLVTGFHVSEVQVGKQVGKESQKSIAHIMPEVKHPMGAMSGKT